MRLAYGEGQKKVRGWIAVQAPGLEFHYRDAAEELGMDPQSVSGILNRTVQAVPSLLERGAYKGMYRTPGRLPDATRNPEPQPANGHRPPQQDTGELMVVVGTLSNGHKMLRDEDGGLWEAGKA